MELIKDTEKINSFATGNDVLPASKRKELHDKFQEANLTNDTLFGMAMENEEFCKIVLSIILDRDIMEITYQKTQSTLQGLPGYKSVRLDVFAIDSEGSTYNVEIQNGETDSMPKRARFYQGILDVNTLYTGKEFKFQMLPKNYIIFITNFDCFGENRYQYTFTNQCHESPGLEFGDETTKIFLNLKGLNTEETRIELIQFMNLIKETKPENVENSENLKRLYQVVKNLKGDKGEEENFMTLEWKEEKGIEKGMKQGIGQGIQGMVSTLKDLNIPDDTILKKLQEKFSITLEEAQSYINRC